MTCSTSHGSSVPGDDEPYLRWLARRGRFGKQRSAGGDGGEASWDGQRSGDVGGCGVIGRGAGSAGAAHVPRPAARPAWPPQEGYPLVGRGGGHPVASGAQSDPEGDGGESSASPAVPGRSRSWPSEGSRARRGVHGLALDQELEGEVEVAQDLHLGEAGPLHAGIAAVGLRRPSKLRPVRDVELGGRAPMIEGRRLREPVRPHGRRRPEFP
jgi:hypothetical protein